MLKRAGSIVLVAALTTTGMPQEKLTLSKNVVKAEAETETEVVREAEGVTANSDYELVYSTTPSGGYNASYNKNFDDQNKYTGSDLGCNYSKEKTVFKVWSPTASKVVLCRYEKGSGSNLIEEVEMDKESNGVWSYTVEGDIVNTYYTYKYTNNGSTSEGVDIYAKAAGVNGERGMVVDLDSTDPEGWDTNYERTATNISDIITWEVHINDFSYDEDSGMENKGKYLAFTENGTKLKGTDYATGIDYLKELGVTHVQILPMYDFGSVDESKPTSATSVNDKGETVENYNWGYDPVNFNVPEGSYSTDPKDGNVRINELKQMIQALHDAGIKVIMDVVYNHTFVQGTNDRAYFDEAVPNYYYRTNSSGKTNGSGCGNEVRTEAFMANKFIRESLLYWAEEYNLDGFRFDLMGLYDVDTMKDIRRDMDNKFGKDTIVMYGEGWTGDGNFKENGAGKQNCDALSDVNIAFFNDQSRDALHGDAGNRGVGQIGMVQQHYGVGRLDAEKYPLSAFAAIQGSAGKNNNSSWWMYRGYWANSSNQSITYDSCHDNKALWDKILESFGASYDTKEEKYIAMNRLTAGYVVTSHGGNFLHAGEEFARTKQGTENSYSSGAEINKLDWSRLSDYHDLVEYYKGMIAVRKAFSGFRTEYKSNGSTNENDTNGGFKAVNNSTSVNFSNIDSFTSCSNSNLYSIGYYLSNNVAGEWNQVAVLINNQTTEKQATLSASDGSSQWVIVSDGKKASVEGVSTSSGNTITVPAKSVVVAVPKKTFDANPDVGKTNSAPVLQVKDVTASVGEKVEFTVTATDLDNDAVSLTANNVPDGATFDAKTGKFIWENAQKGTYEVKFTATDGTATTTKTITITVSSTTDALDNSIAKVEAAGYSEDMFVKATWNTLCTALENAKNVADNTGATTEECNTVLANLESAYTKATEEIKAAEDLEAYITTASDKITKADGIFDAELVEDAKTVLEEAKALLENKAVARGYNDAKANLEDSVNCLVTGSTKPCVRVSSAWENPYIYVWTGDGTTAVEYTGEWPGAAMTEKDSDGNYYIELEEDIEYKIIINAGLTGKKQTEDLKSLSGDITIAVADTSSSTDTNGNSVYKATTECKELSTGTTEISKDSLKSVIDEASKYCEGEIGITELTFTTLCSKYSTAKQVYENAEATQLEVNQATRALRAALLDYLYTSGDIDLVTPTPTPSETPSETPICQTTSPASTEPDDTMPPSDNTGETDNPGNSDAPVGTTPPVSTAPASIAPPVSDDPNNTQDSNGGTNQGGTSDPDNTNDPVIIPTKDPNGTVITTQPPNSNGGENNPVIIPTKDPNGTVIPTPSANTATEVPSGNVTATPITSATVPPANVGNTTPTPTATATNKPSNSTTSSTSNGFDKNSDLTVTLEMNKVSPQKAGTKINLSAIIEGEQGECEYYFYYKKSGSKGYTTLQEYSSSDTCVWQPKAGGTYSLYVTVKDSTGVTVTTCIKPFKISALSASIKMNKKSPQLKKTTMKIKVNAKNGVGKIKYQYIIKLKNKTKKKTAYRTSNVYAWKPDKAGTYKLYVKIKDANTTIVKKKSFVIK